MDKEILDIEGVSKLLGVSKYTVYRLIKDNKIPVTRVGKKFRFHRGTIIEWVATGSNANQLERILKSNNVRIKRN